jgi:hypothetical protein
MAGESPRLLDCIGYFFSALGGKSFVDISSALLTPIIGITTAYVAYQQYRINKTRLKLEQYERRLTVYKSVDTFYGEVGAAGNVKYSDVSKLRVETAEAEFLFPSPIRKHLDGLYKKAIRVAVLQDQMYPRTGGPGIPVGQERTRVAEEHGQLVLWLIQQAKPESKKLFGKHLRLL